jgi:TPR repeat protein
MLMICKNIKPIALIVLIFVFFLSYEIKAETAQNLNNEFLKAIESYQNAIKNNSSITLPLNNLRSLAEKGHNYSQYFLGTLCMADMIGKYEGVKWLEEAEENGCSGASGILGMMYMNGAKGLEKNSEKGEKKLLEAASKGDIMSQVTVASFYKHGSVTIAQDKIMAYAWISLACDQCYSEKRRRQLLVHKIVLESELDGSKKTDAINAAINLKNKIGIFEYSYCSQSAPIIPEMKAQ